jgi:hypothetical protein
MGKRVSTRRVKKHRLYTYEEAGNALGVTSHTVRAWRASGLEVMTASKPHYILGAALIDFIERKQAKRSGNREPDEMLCFTCNVYRKPLGGLVDYIPITDTRGRLMGLCGTCDGSLHRFAGKADLGKFDGIYDVVIKGVP